MVSLNNSISYFYSFTRSNKFKAGFVTHGFPSTFRYSVVFQYEFTLILACSNQHHGKESFWVFLLAVQNITLSPKNRSFVTAGTKDCQLSLSESKKFKSNLLSPTLSRSVLVILLLSYIPLEISRSLPSIFPTKTIYGFLFSLLHATYPTHHILSDKTYRGAKITQFLVIQFLPSPTYSIPITKECIVSSDILSTFALYASFNVRGKFPRPQKRRGTITFLPVLFFMAQTRNTNVKGSGTGRSQHFRKLNCALFF